MPGVAKNPAEATVAAIDPPIDSQSPVASEPTPDPTVLESAAEEDTESAAEEHNDNAAVLGSLYLPARMNSWRTVWPGQPKVW